MKVHFVGGPKDGMEELIDHDPPPLWKVPIPQDPPTLITKCWIYYYSPENKTYYVRRGVHDG